MLERAVVTSILFDAKRNEGLTFAELGKALGRDPVWVAALFHGQATLDDAEAEKLADLLDLNLQQLDAAKVPPSKGALETDVPGDPVIYRLHEITQVYGPAIKDIIHETFGDGLMSTADLKVSVAKQADPAGDRVVITYDGRFEPYRKW